MSQEGIKATKAELFSTVSFLWVGVKLDILEARHASDDAKSSLRYLEQVIVVVRVALHPDGSRKET